MRNIIEWSSIPASKAVMIDLPVICSYDHPPGGEPRFEEFAPKAVHFVYRLLKLGSRVVVYSEFSAELVPTVIKELELRIIMEHDPQFRRGTIGEIPMTVVVDNYKQVTTWQNIFQGLECAGSDIVVIAYDWNRMLTAVEAGAQCGLLVSRKSGSERDLNNGIERRIARTPNIRERVFFTSRIEYVQA